MNDMFRNRRTRRPSPWLFAAVALGFAAAAWLLRPGRRLPTQARTTERDGVGPVTVRRYWVEVQGAQQAPEAVVRAALDRFPELMPRPLAITRKVRGKPGQGAVGDRFFILMLIRRGLVETEIVEPLRFRERTLRLHPESGYMEFSAQPGEAGRYRLQVETRARTSTWADRLAYLLGMIALQEANWQIVLGRAAELSGGEIVDRGSETVEFGSTPRD